MEYSYDEVQRLVRGGAISPQTAEWMLQQRAPNTDLITSQPPEPIASAAPPAPLPDGGTSALPDVGQVRSVQPPPAPGRWDSGAGGAPNQEPRIVQPTYQLPSEPQGSSGAGGAPGLYRDTGAGGYNGAPTEQPPEQQTPPPPKVVDPNSIIKAPPPVTGTVQAPQARPRASGGAGAGGPKFISEYVKNTRSNFDEQKRNLENQRDFDQVNAAMSAASQQEDYGMLESQDRIRQSMHEQRSKKAEAALADLNARADALARTGGKDRWYSSTSDRMLASFLLGGDKVQELIDKDVDRQKQMWEREKDSFAARSSNFGRQMQLYKDADMADASSRILEIDRAQRRLQVMSASNQPESIRLMADRAMTALNQNRAKWEYDFQAAAYNAAHSGKSSSTGWHTGTLYPNEQAFWEGYARARELDPTLTPEKFYRTVQTQGKGGAGSGGGGSSRYGVAAEKAGLAKRALADLEKQMDAGADTSYVAAKLQQVGNWFGDLWGTQASAARSAAKEGAAVETAGGLSGTGQANELLIRKVSPAFDTNDPNKIRAAIKHYKGQVEEAEARFNARGGGPQHRDEFPLPDESDEDEKK